MVSAIQTKGAELFKKTKRNYLKVVASLLDELVYRELITQAEKKILFASYKDIAILHLNTKNSSRIALLSQKRYDDLLYSAKSTDVGKSLAELLHSVIIKNGKKISNPGTSTSKAQTSTTIPGGSGASIALWAGMGAAIGGSIGGGLGAVIGGAIGAAVGACGGDTEVTVTTGSGTGGTPA